MLLRMRTTAATRDGHGYSGDDDDADHGDGDAFAD